MKKKSRSFLLIVLISSLIYPVTQSDSAGKIAAEIDTYMSQAVEKGFSGALLVAGKSGVIISSGYGMANREKGIPVSSETVFTVGSVTKQFTAAAILKLQMMGKMRVTDPMADFFSNVPADKKDITLHHLLTHSAGFPGAIGDDFEPISAADFIKLALATPLRRKPGMGYEYSNVGYSILGIIVEKVSELGYEQFLKKHLFDPAGMKQTGYQLPAWGRDQLAIGYRNDKAWGTLRDRSWRADGPGWHLRANGGIMSTLADMYKWHLALLDNRILDDSAKQSYYKPHVREGEGASSFYGYGWAIFETSRKTRLIAHNGGNSIFAADFLRYLDEGVVVVAFSNTAGKQAFRISGTTAKIVFGETYSPPSFESRSRGENSSEGDWGLPSSDTGRNAGILLDILARGNDQFTRASITKYFSPSLLQKQSLKAWLSYWSKYAKKIGKFQLSGANKTGPTSARLLIESLKSGDGYYVTFQLEDLAPYRIVAVKIEKR